MKIENRCKCNVDNHLSAIRMRTATGAAADLPFCLPVGRRVVQPTLPNDRGTLVALGILSTSSRTVFRDTARATYLRELPADVSAAFVMRGRHLNHSTRVSLSLEARVHSDMLFVNASAELPRESGPLHSIYLWFLCATQRYPHVPFVGKLDDDTWLNAGALATLLRGHVLPWVGRPFEAYVGAFATYHWDERRDGGPVFYREIPCTLPCARKSGSSIAGPYNFAKGPAFVLSAALARLLSHSDAERPARDPRCLNGSLWFWRGGTTQDSAAAAMASASTDHGEAHREACGTPFVPRLVPSMPPAKGVDELKYRWGSIPWEDVWVGCKQAFASGSLPSRSLASPHHSQLPAQIAALIALAAACVCPRSRATLTSASMHLSPLLHPLTPSFDRPPHGSPPLLAVHECLAHTGCRLHVPLRRCSQPASDGSCGCG
jgi:hypothetical protein